MKKSAKLLALLLALVMVFSLAACGNGDDSTDDNNTNNNASSPTPTPAGNTGDDAPEVPDTYTYNYSLATFPTVWNIHDYETATDAEIVDYITSAFYIFDYNEEGDGYALIPGMTTDEHPVDVTADYVGQYGIEEGDENQVYVINLRDDLRWEDGTPITAHDFVESAKRLLDPLAKNYRADGLYTGDMIIHNAQNYLYSGVTEQHMDNSLSPEYLTMDDLTLGEDGVYTTPQGKPVYIATGFGIDWLGGNSLQRYIDSYGDSMFDVAAYEALNAQADENGLVPLNDENLAYLVSVITFSPNWGETDADAPSYFVYEYTYAEMPWEEVGMFALSDTELVIAIDQPLVGFYLKYSLTSSWLVNIEMYDACTTVEDGVYTNTYGTSAETTMSYGPYKLESFQADKQYVLVRNDEYYNMTDDTYQATSLVVDYVPEAATRLELFLQGKLDTYGLTVDDMATYQMSDYTYYAIGDSTFAIALNPGLSQLEEKQAAAGPNINKTILTLEEFRMALSLALDRNAFCLATSPTNSPAFGLYSSLIISDPDNGTPYRTTEVAKNVLAEFWGVSEDYGEGKLYADLDEAIESITGYNLDLGQQYFDAAYDRAIAEGLMDEDDTIQITVGIPNPESTFYNNGYNFLVNNYTEAVKGTKLEGKLTFTRDDTVANEFATALQNNQIDMLFGVGWTGSALNPYGLMEAYISQNYQYDSNTDFTHIDITIEIDGTEYTAPATDWYQVMNGTPTVIVAADGTEMEYKCGSTDGDPETRLEILGQLEGAVLLNYNFIPIMDNATAQLRGQQINYHTEEYIFGMGFGGIQYYTFEYTDAEWDAYVAENNGELDYT